MLVSVAGVHAMGENGPMAIFYDTHAHMDYPDYAEDVAQVIERAQAAGITRIITIGTDLESSARAIKLCERFPSVFAAVGWHPTNALEAPEDAPLAASSTSDIDEYFDSAPIPAAAFDEPVPTYAPAAPAAAPKPAPAAAPVPATKPPFKDDGSI